MIADLSKSSLNVDYSYNKRKSSLEGTLNWVLFAAEFDFLKILVPWLPQNSSNASNCILYVASFLVQWYILIILFSFYLIISAVNYVIYGSSYSRVTSGVITTQRLHTEEKNVAAVITQNRVIDETLESQTKNRT